MLSYTLPALLRSCTVQYVHGCTQRADSRKVYSVYVANSVVNEDDVNVEVDTGDTRDDGNDADDRVTGLHDVNLLNTLKKIILIRVKKRLRVGDDP